MPGTAAIVGAIVAAGTAAYSVSSNEQAKKKAQEQEDQQNAQLVQAKKESDNQKNSNLNMSAANALRARVAGVQGGPSQGGSILTSPLGLSTQPQTTGKTLLGV